MIKLSKEIRCTALKEIEQYHEKLGIIKRSSVVLGEFLLYADSKLTELANEPMFAVTNKNELEQEQTFFDIHTNNVKGSLIMVGATLGLSEYTVRSIFEAVRHKSN